MKIKSVETFTRDQICIVRRREFKNIRLQSEDVAELSYRPTACRKAYRVVVAGPVGLRSRPERRASALLGSR